MVELNIVVIKSFSEKNMENKEIHTLVLKQREYFKTGETHSTLFRVKMLKKLYAEIEKREEEITAALRSDLGKSDFEAFMCEIGMTLSEISHMIKNIKKWAGPKRVKTPISQFPSRSYTIQVPFGNTLIMSPWNYPFLLTLGPLVDAIAAGNTAILKPSAYSPATSDAVEKIISAVFSPEYVAVVRGGRAENEGLLSEKFDFVFFTGSEAVGREVLRHTAEYLTPAVLELGGKSPCIVDRSAKLAVAAKRIVFGKFLNCGQTCVAPDYILCDSSVKKELVSLILEEITRQFGEKPLSNPDYGKIINKKHFDRIMGLIDKTKVVSCFAADAESERVAPVVMDNVTWNDAVMKEEIFGPVLPILTFDDLGEVIELLSNKPKPLALYLFSENKENIEKITARVRYGGGCINDTVIHLATSEMGFGGVGESGMGSYHGKAGFDTFSHTKSIVDKKTWLDLPMRYQPYDRKKHFKTVRSSMK